MSVFRYKMQNILNIKLQLEEQAKMQFAAARARLNEEEEKLRALYERRQMYVDEGIRFRQDSISVLDLRNNERAVAKMDEYIKEQKMNIRIAEKNVEQAREKMTSVIIERKSHEKLKEKAFEEFMEEEKAAESKEIDQLTSYIYTAKKEG